MLMVLATTFVTPPALARVANRAPRRHRRRLNDGPSVADTGLEELVSGAVTEERSNPDDRDR
jgi:hypothetical protein